MLIKEIIGVITSGYSGSSPISTVPYAYSPIDAAKAFHIILSGRFTHNTGQEIISLEREFSDYIGTKFALATNSGTSSLHLAVKAVGVQPGDEIIVPGYTFVAAAQAVLLCGGVPVFADIDDTFTLSPASVEAVITHRTKAIIVAHMFGNVADMKSILVIAKKYHLFVIEDCAQAVGAKWQNKRVGSIGDVGCFSFNEKKAIPLGQGGMLTTSNALLHRNAVSTRNTGIEMIKKKVDVTTIGSTFFMTELQAALARRVLPRLDKLNNRRTQHFLTIEHELEAIQKYVKVQRRVQGAEPSYSRFICMIDTRNANLTREACIDRLRAEGIPMKTFYPVPLNEYSLFQKKSDLITGTAIPYLSKKYINYRSIRLPFTKQFCLQQMGMELSPYISHKDATHIGKSLRNIFENL